MTDFKDSMDRINARILETERVINALEVKIPFNLDDVSLSIRKLNGTFRVIYNGRPATDWPVLQKIWIAERLDDLMTAYQAELVKVADRARKAGRKP